MSAETWKQAVAAREESERAVESLRAELARVEAELSVHQAARQHQKDELARVEAGYQDAKTLMYRESDRADNAERECVRLREGLTRYGSHDGECGAAVPSGSWPCDCGLAGLLSGGMDDRAET